MKKKYIVLMDSGYVRDAQMVDTDAYTDEEFDNGGFHDEEHIEDWTDMSPTPYIDMTDAGSDTEAIDIVSKLKRYDPRLLYAVEVPLPKMYIANVLCNISKDGRLVKNLETIKGIVLATDGGSAMETVRTGLQKMAASKDHEIQILETAMTELANRFMINGMELHFILM